jgi:hypothetical protein
VFSVSSIDDDEATATARYIVSTEQDVDVASCCKELLLVLAAAPIDGVEAKKEDD